MSSSERWIAKIGNTRAVFWNTHKQKKFILTEDILNDSKKLHFLGHGRRASELVVSSVVPKATALLRQRLERVGFRFQEIKSKDIPLRAKYSQGFGIDRHLNLFGASKLSQRPLIVMDFGTAITVDFLDQKRRHRGGWILAGLSIMARALHEHTAKLPLVNPRSAKSLRSDQVTGWSTRSCLSVAQRQYAEAMIDRAIKLGRRLYDKKAFLVLTGGDAEFLKDRADVFDPMLSMKAMKDLLK